MGSFRDALSALLLTILASATWPAGDGTSWEDLVEPFVVLDAFNEASAELPGMSPR